MKKLNKRGFTIVELVVVIAVIAILAGVLIPSLSSVVTNAKKSAALQEVKNAYDLTLSEDLLNKTENVYGVSNPIIVVHEGVTISITNGAAEVVGSGTATHTLEAATHTLKPVTGGGDNN